MKKLHFVVLIATVTLTACLPAFLQPSADPAQQPDVGATIAAGLTEAAQTLVSQATPTLIPSATRTASPTHSLTATQSAVPTASITLTETVFATLTTGTAVTPTNVTGTPSTLVPATETAPSGSPTPTLYPRFFGTLPPGIPAGTLKIINRSKSEVYISLQCVTTDGQISILEYPVPRRLEIQAPAGKYIYVAWVGGKKMSGQFSLGKANERMITIYKDRIVVR